MEETKMPDFAMTLVIDWDGQVSHVKDYNEQEVEVKPVPSNHHHVKDVQHVVGVYQGSRCVTYQTPSGPKTV